MNTRSNVETLPTELACRQAILAIVSSGKYEILLLTRNLDSRYYGSSDLGQCLQRFLLDNPRAKLLVLVADSRTAATQHPLPLLDLRQRLSSRVEIRELPGDQAESVRIEWLIVDWRQVLERDLTQRGFCRCWRDAPQHARKRRNTFMETWHQSLPAQWLRPIHL